ncbi:MAG: phosphocholine cytidylyltransferase family protein [Acidobacteriota bacterium]
MTPRAVILAAGSAQRLRPLTDALPKCLLRVGGRTILARAVSILAGWGVREITVVDGFEGDRLRAAIAAEFPPEWFHFIRNDDYATTNNAWSLWLARGAAPEPILLLDADVVFDREVIGLLLTEGPQNRLAVRTRGAVGAEDMKVALAPDGRVADIGKHLPPASASGESIGIAHFGAQFSRRMFSVLERRLVKEGLVGEWYESAFVELISGGEAIHPIDIGGHRAIEIDTPEDLEEARRLFPEPPVRTRT